jgi:putative heme-binding domain-containing protein
VLKNRREQRVAPACPGAASHARTPCSAFSALLSALLLVLLTAPVRGSDAITDLLTELKGADVDLQRSLLSGVVQGMLGVRSAKAPAVWGELSPTLTTSDDARVRLTAQHLAALFGDVQSVSALNAVLDDRGATVIDRRRALRALLHVHAEGLQARLVALLDDGALRPFVLAALAERDDAATPDAIIAVYSALTLEERLIALNTLASRASYANALIAAVGAGTVPARDLTASVLRQLALLDNPTITAFVTAQKAGPDADPLGEVARLHGVLKPDVLASGDRARGKALFERTCAQCHTLWGGKANLGPDLTGLNRPDLDWVLKNVIDPTAIMGAEQQVLVARLADGRVVAGMKKEDAPAHLALQNEAGLVTMPKSEITALEETRRSTMPDGLFRPMSTAELADFLAYFMGTGPLAP